MKILWTEEMKQTLKKFADFENYSYTNIAKIMTAEYGVKFTKNSCVGMASRLGVPKREPVIKIKPVIKPEEFTIYDLEWGMCKWPLGGPYDKPPFLYCGRNTENGTSWCPMHCKKAFNSSFYSSSFRAPLASRPAR